MKGVGYAVWVGAGGDSEELRLEQAGRQARLEGLGGGEIARKAGK